ncbi:MAG: ABC transporter ATP-binding protein [Candidatus Synechococcus spongiarum 142]|uniref:ABC transporter ATP-binding protein n=1 Tax=Candidatus Synechococcus spongiarum 142 TaxID=1608213 RepID=A0A6N3X5H8_9SYNE|nr:MAG: ABC transporter ATP-binding protein [Candidatus Synechococcus spongiarum 142]
MPLIPSLRHQFSNFLTLTRKLHRLTQPYFLPLEEANGWQFLGLLVALIFCVGGVVLFLLTALMAAVHSILPQLTDTYLGGVEGSLSTIWSSWWGVLFCGLFAVGCLSFFALRRQLRRRRWLPWLLLGVIIFMLLAVNSINAGITFIARDLTDAFIAQESESSYRNLWIYAICFIVALPIRSFQLFFTAKLGILWREWLSKSLVTNYMTDRAYYRINPNDEQATDTDNPDQRISEDTGYFTVETLGFALDIFDSILVFLLNILILWSISTELTFALFAYALIFSTILIIVGRKLVTLNYNQLRYEADFRYGLVHVRDNAESIAFYRGEKQEQEETERRLGIVVKNFNLLIIWQTIIGVIQRSVIYGSNLIPYVVLIGPILSGEMTYGRFVQANVAFNLVESSVFLIINNITYLARFSASIGRLASFQTNIEAAIQESHTDQQAIPGGDRLMVRHATLATPQTNRVLIEDLNLSVGDNEHLLVVGPSGCGKTSLLRMVSGLWSPREGTVESPRPDELLFIPQKPYMTLGTLREQLCYPQQPDPALFSDDHLRSVLELVNLGVLVQRYPDFNVKQDWPRLLSLGEQQRLAFARLLLNSPRYVVLDEATSAVDVKTERHLYNLLAERNIAFISVGHRPTLTAFHDNVLELDGSGAWRLLPARGYGMGQA